MKPCLRPQRKQRLTIRVENLGFFLDLAITDVLAILLFFEWNPYFGVKFHCLVATLFFGHNRDFKSERDLGRLGAYLWKYNMLF